MIRRGAAVLAAAVLVTATVSASTATARTAPDELTSSITGSARMDFPPPGHVVRVTVDAHAKFAPDGSSFPKRSWGTFRVSHRVNEPGQPPRVNWGDFEVDCLTTGGPTATVTGRLVRAAPDSPWTLGDRTGLSFYVSKHKGRSRIGMAGSPEIPLPRCMAPAADSLVIEGGYTLKDRHPSK